MTDPASGKDWLRKARFETQVRWQYSGRRRIAGMTWLAHRLPWSIWCRLCAWNAEAIVAEMARRARTPLTFVQIGSCDGVANDPLHETVVSHHWPGVLVEPIPRLFEQLVGNYKDLPQLQFCNVAVANEVGTATMYAVKPQAGDPEWVDQLASFDREVVLRHAYALPNLEGRIFQISVESMPLGSLVARCNLSAIDLLHIDAEGFDDEIIGQVDMGASWAPRYVIFEQKHLDRDRWVRVREMLEGGGYRLVNLWPDMLAYRNAP